MDEEALYKHRFNDAERQRRLRLWPVLIDNWLARWIRTTDAVLDLGSSDAAFINSVHASRRVAVDINPALADVVEPPVEAFIGTLSEANLLEEVDVIMASNIFEHLPSVEALTEVLTACRRALVRGGTLLILQPNFRYTTKVFYDYLDHHLPLTHRSLEEALVLSGFEVIESIPRFLPYSVKNQRWAPNWALALYLKIPLLWRIVGKQMFLVARKPTESAT
jgi:SAM-dependent methyltransferase